MNDNKEFELTAALPFRFIIMISLYTAMNQENNQHTFSISQCLLRRILFSLLFFLFPALCALAEAPKLGLSAPLSGGGAGWGNDVKNVLLFANEKLANGKYSFVFEDDRCDPKTSLSVARKLTSVDHVKAVFIVCGQATLAATKVYRNRNVTVMATLATPSGIAGLGAYRTSLNDALAAKKLAEEVAKQHRLVAVLTEENDYPVSFLQDFLHSANELKLKVNNQNYLPGQQDFRAQLLRLKKQGIQALFLNTQTEEALANLLRQLKELSYSPALYGAYLPGSEHFLKIGGKLAEGLRFVDFPAAEELLTAEGKALYTEYISRFGPLQGWSFAFPATFEAFRAVHLALTSVGSVEEYLQRARFEGIIGSYSFDQQGDIVGPQHVIRVIRDGRSVSLK